MYYIEPYSLIHNMQWIQCSQERPVLSLKTYFTQHCLPLFVLANNTGRAAMMIYESA